MHVQVYFVKDKLTAAPTVLQELEVLRHAATLPDQDANKHPSGPPPAIMASLRAAASALGHSSRDETAQRVFRPSHALPTVTLAQQVESPLTALYGCIHICRCAYIFAGVQIRKVFTVR